MPQKTIFSNDLSQGKRNQQYQSTLLIAALAAVLGILPALYRWTVRALLRRNLRYLREGDLEPLFSTYADDIRFVFPGKNSWAGEFRGKDEVKRWVRRVSQVGLRLEPQEMLVARPPWDTTFALRFTDRCTAPDVALAVFTSSLESHLATLHLSSGVHQLINAQHTRQASPSPRE